MEKRLRVIGDGLAGIGYKVFLGDDDISRYVKDIKITMSAGEVNVAQITLVSAIELDGVFDVTAIGDEFKRFIREGLMAKVSGKNGVVLIGGYDFSTESLQWDVSLSANASEVTGFGDGSHNFLTRPKDRRDDGQYAVEFIG